MGSTKLNKDAVLGADVLVSKGESIRSVARSLGVTHRALAKRLRALREPTEVSAPVVDERAVNGGYTDMEVAVIVAVADAGVAGGLEFMAEVFGGSVLDVVEVARRRGLDADAAP